MHGSKKRLTAVAAVSIAALALSACAESEREPSTGDGDGGGTFVFGTAGDPGSLDPAFATDGETFRVTRQM
nr:ABC transporter substrate-binding protein [Geodermatophilaceae bacterium]